MKKIVLLFIICFFCYSCSKVYEFTYFQEKLIGKWTLQSMASSRPYTISIGDAMLWQESYTFNTDSSFTKTRVTNSKSITAVGSYSYKRETDGDYIVLTYSKKSEIIGSCTGNFQEILLFVDKNTLSSTWKNCDGPEREYKK